MMPAHSPSKEVLTDFITGRIVPNVGAEANRQQVERWLVETKGYAPEDIEVDAPITMEIEDERYTSSVDLVISVRGKRYMVIKCAPGSLASREREVIAAARLLGDYQIPLAIASDGRTALVWETVTGHSLGQGLEAVPTKSQAESTFDPASPIPLDEKRRTRQKLIFRSYDSMNINKAGKKLK
jgi:hypothetical protein